MDNRLQELTDKIYQEGISKGNEEAQRIVADAKAEAASILEAANKEAAAIKATAEKTSAELKDNTLSELKLASNQAIEALKQEIVSVVNGQITTPEIKAANADTAFVQSAIETAIKNWAANNDKEIDMSILIPATNEKAINDYFSGAAKEVLNKGFKIETVNGVKSGFQIAPADGSYKISFTDEDFISFFQEYLRPKVIELLYAK